MRRRLLVMVAIVMLALTTALPAFAGAEDLCHSYKFQGIDFADFDGLPVPVSTAVPPTLWIDLSDADHYRIEVAFEHGHARTLIIDYYENWGDANDFIGFQCRTEPPGGAIPSDDEMSIIVCTGDSQRPQCDMTGWSLIGPIGG